MTCDLEVAFADLAGKLSEDEEFLFSAQTLPNLREQMATNRLIIQQRIHQYNDCFRADALWFQATKTTYRHVGLLILAGIFHQDSPTVHIALTHPASDVKRMVVEYNAQMRNEIYHGYTAQPHSFRYQFEEASKHPWKRELLDPRNLPCFWLTQWQASVVTDADWHNRDTLIGFGSAVGSIRFAELLLNASDSRHLVDEYNLEGPWDIQGVGRYSAEVTLFLPGSQGWDGAL
ncbi:MAG: hypothetical protein MI924_26315 [Chloroflexales bacterium]|nr:hypothetical protein [Chloroflexales bacterium]